jgi:putative ABC transport system permease protein
MEPRRTPYRVSWEKTLASARQTVVLSELVQLALGSFRAARMQFALTAVGMVIGTACVILVVTIADTGKEYILGQIQAVGSNLVELQYVGGGTDAVGNVRTDFLTFPDEAAIDTAVPSVAISSVVLEMYQSINFSGGLVKQVEVLGVEPQYRQVRNLVVRSGRFFDDEDETTHAHVAVVTENFAHEMFGTSAAAINRTFQINELPFTIVGTFREAVDTFGETEISDDTVLIPYSVARYFSGTDNVNEIYFSVRDGANVQDVAQQIEDAAHARHLPSSKYKSSTLLALLVAAAHIVNALTIMLLLFAAVMLAVGGVGIMNIMLATVHGRTREIGIRKALGATAREIRLQFLIEAVFTSLLGGLVGVVIGIGIPLSIRLITSYRIPVSLWSIVAGLTASTAVGVIFGTLPANRAAAMDPIESLRYE